MSIYEIDKQIMNAIELGYDPETGEIFDEAALEKLQMDRNDKIENLLLWVKDLRAEAKAVRNERKALDARADAADKKADSIAAYVQKALNGEKFSTSRCAVSYRKSSSVQVIDQGLIPDEYLRKRTYVEPDKIAIKDVLKSGGKVPGAYLDEKQSMTIK